MTATVPRNLPVVSLLCALATIVVLYGVIAWVLTTASISMPPQDGVSGGKASSIASTELGGAPVTRTHLGQCADIVRSWIRAPSCGRGWVWEVDVAGDHPGRVIVDYKSGKVLWSDPFGGPG
ncbi:MAG: hypothetical protein QOK05_1686 [Chloroflexota bacterium]|jgi:hypothetical protein|nr:hypothetical protein [Chloroflexota bacterium]